MRVNGATRSRAAAVATDGLPTATRLNPRTVRNWTRRFESTGELPKSCRGYNQKITSLVYDEDFMTKCGEWLHVQTKNKRAPQLFQNYLNTELLPMITGAVKTSVSLSSATRWMKRIGYRYGMWKKAVYTDGHERDDVKRYREKFCAEFLRYTEIVVVRIHVQFAANRHSSQMRFYRGECMDQIEMPVDIAAPEVVWVTHDESVFYANDDGGRGWSNSETPDLHKKGRGRSIMVSDFFCPCHGRLFELEGGDRKYVTQVLEIGKNHEGYWTSDHVMHQVQNHVLAAFTAMHPSCTALFTFDQSTNHAAFAPDALRATNMNMTPGGAQALLRPGFHNGNVQAMVFGADLDRAGQAKGLKQVLAERGIDVAARKIKMKCAAVDVDVNSGTILECCARHCMASHPDFLAQKSILEETIEAAGHICFLLPKYHCELNPIESYWGAAKRFARFNCDYTFTGLQACVPKSLDSVPLTSIRKFFCRCFHFIQSYSYGCDYKLTRFAHKKYKSHPRIPESILLEKDSI